MVAEHGIPPPPQERIPEKICEQIVDVFVSQVTGLPKTSSRDRTSQRTVEQILNDPVPEMVTQLVEVPNTVAQDRIKQRTVEHISEIPVPQVMEELVEVFKVFPQDRIQQRLVVQTIDTPGISLAEKIVEGPVTQMQGKTQQGVNTHAQHVVNTVAVEKPKIIELTVQRKKPIIQEKINQVTKHVEIPLSQFTDKVVDKPVVVQRQISTVLTVQKNIEISQLQVDDKVVDIPVMLVVRVPQVRIVKKTVEDSQLQIVEKTIENPETQISGVVTDACLTCDVKCKVACQTCVKDNMFMVAGEMTVAGKGTTRLSHARVTTIAGDSFMSMAQAAACISSTHQDKQKKREKKKKKKTGEGGQREEGEKGRERRERKGS